MSAPPSGPVWGVLLAAGESRRMGRPKQLAPLWGETLVRRAALALAGGGFGGLLAVVPPGEVGEQVRGALRGLPYAFAVNPDPARGLAGSFRVAGAALPPGLAAAHFALADMPLVSPGVHARLLSAFRQTGAPLVLAEYGEAGGGEAVRAPPHLLRADLLAALPGLPDADHGPRALLRQHAGQAVTLRFPAALLADVDTPDDLARLAGEGEGRG
ncbi:nucleotidyltransferase family protein [Deinococcus budaensis]|uniref:CTP:molybdopterin cytidylyltransferase MocA n=1 Tax=Deinococcus budaensis TaxID=1665626 RepID=A0A7W8GEA6_9DEIO|nr:nucleotidyltransferase family protein [Deinococcus budaensis]MBB5233738.1 CTP:molybdopterin cytidylyltransferase MocA [Deinococcus budaensis]